MLGKNKKASLNEPEFPTMSKEDELEIDVNLLAKCLSKIKFFIPMARHYLNDEDLEIIKKYAP